MLRIGLDFDNTIVSYDTLFHKVAFEQGHIPARVARDKNAVRDYLREKGHEEIWTEMQGYVYGARMNEAQAFDDAIDVMKELKETGHQLFIISHKTRAPYAGPPYDLHAAARGWIKHHLNDSKGEPVIADSDVYFHETKDEKVSRIRQLKCDIFLDDLPEILLHKNFPADVKRCLFNCNASDAEDWEQVRSWRDFADVVRRG